MVPTAEDVAVPVGGAATDTTICHMRRSGSHGVVCGVGLTVPEEHANAEVLVRLKASLLHPAVIETAIERAVAYLCEPDIDARGLRQELAQIEQKLERLTNANAAGAGEVPELVRALRVADQQRANLLSRLRVIERSAADLNPKDVAADIRARLTEWRAILHDEAAKAHRSLRQLIVGRLELRAEADGSGFTFSGVGTLVPLLSGTIPAFAAIVPRIDSSPTGFDPLRWLQKQGCTLSPVAAGT